MRGQGTTSPDPRERHLALFMIERERHEAMIDALGAAPQVRDYHRVRIAAFDWAIELAEQALRRGGHGPERRR